MGLTRRRSGPNGAGPSRQHLDNIDGQCPLMALPSDTARAGPKVRASYQRVLEALIDVFEINVATSDDTGADTGSQISSRQRGLAIAATCVGAMVLARTIEDADLADEICDAARTFAAVEFGAAGSTGHPATPA